MKTTDLKSAAFTVIGVVGTLTCAAASIGLGWWALATAPGVTHVGNDEYRTDFANAEVMALIWWLILPVFFIALVAGWRWWLASTTAVTLPQIVVAAIVVHRYQVTGWGDGLEVFAYLLPIALAVAGLIGGGLICLLRWQFFRGPRRSASLRAA